ncbi:tetraacyldisaccharide 4'-kinase [Acidipila rosea]|uniref:Tetraacyldisaccharide 4'-kinase n=1 Tax=Acidipila rosea TaxID=768535 RepID=A0A4R1L3W9_9BACT|nr:tetraacyldisaccharide 4'-kinase [Acidipila rosea]TCK71777.1 lipid-A-disaccharide kinase [Acidipila rosea]
MNRLFAPLVPLYGGAVDLKNMAYDSGRFQAKRLAWPVVSIGNLSVGGAGKTPLVIALAALLQARGIAVDVLSRGYGRHSKETERVDPAGDAERYGDEPLLIARRAETPVFVGTDRYETGLLAEAGASAPRVHLLDDGFQHRKLARDADIVLLHRSDFRSSLLPAGRLREPVYALRRASFVVVRSEDDEVLEQLRWRSVHAPVWCIRRELEAPRGIGGGVIAFAGIARPQEFFAGLEAGGLKLAKAIAYRDHQPWTAKKMAELVSVASGSGAEAFVTTEKDAVRLTAAQRQQLESVMPLRVARLTATLEDEQEALDQLLARLRL